MGSFFKGVLTLGIHTMYHHNRVKDLEVKKKSKISEIKEALDKYESIAREKHARHDEIFNW